VQQIFEEVLHLRNISIRRTSIAALGATLLAGAAMHLSTQTASATPSGLSNYPSTDIYGKGTYHFDADYFSNAGGSTTTGSSIGLEYGAGPDHDGLFGRTEFGFDYVTFPNGLDHHERLLFNVKTQLFNNDDAGTRIVTGLYGVGSKKVGAGNWLYLLGSKAFDFGRIHAGVATSLQSRSIVPTNRTVLQLGFDRPISKQLIFSADYQSGSTQFLAPGLIYLINDRAGIQLSYLRGGSAVAPRNQIYFGFDYNFGNVAAPSTPDDPTGGAGGAGGGAGGAGGGGG
jgi:hypothetical protein